MNRIDQLFDQLKAHHRTALIPFITAGDPNPSISLALMHGLVQAGADMIELGVPFSDPMADGPIIQKASERALAQGMSLHRVLDLVESFRQADQKTPIILMGYLNPIEIMGYESFAKQAAAVGVDGVLTVDMPPEESEIMNQACGQFGLNPIYLIAPTSDEHRIQMISHVAKGFIYYVSLKGVTGAANLNLSEVETKLNQIRRHTDLPLGVGFGIKNAETARRMARLADAVVVGSALVAQIEAHLERPEQIQNAVLNQIADIRQGIDQSDRTSE